MREQLAAGLAQPAIVVDLTLDQVAAQGKMTTTDTPLLAAFRRFPSEIAAADQDRLRTQARTAYEQQFVPAWKRLETFLRDTYRKQARPQTALSSLPNGRAAYAALIHAYTTTRMTPEQIHQIGVQEVARIEKEMERLARAAGFTGAVTDFEKQLGQQPGMKFSSQAEMIQYAREVLARLQPALPRLFKRVPKMVVDVRPIPADREASTASNYTAGTADGMRPAWFNMNTYRPQEQVRYRTEALVLHETVPGHHLQIGIARELQGLPEFRKVFTAAAFSEGWGLYAESLGSELGVYRDPTTRFGQLASEQFRAVRLVVDTGLHAMGWSRERAREYFSLHVPGQSLAESRSLHRSAGTGARLQARRAQDQGAASQGRAGARRAVRHPRVSRRRAEERHAPAGPAGRAGPRIHRWCEIIPVKGRCPNVQKNEISVYPAAS